MTTTHDQAPVQVLTIEELEATAPLEAPPSTGRNSLTRVNWKSRVGKTPYRLGRRQILKAAVTVGTTAGLMTLGVLPKAKEASAACVDHLEATITHGCPEDVGDCSPACGPSTVYPDVCIVGGIFHGLHLFSGDYRNRPNQCNSAFPESDGWYWQGRKCCLDCIRNYRCHDGCKRINSAWKNSICRLIDGCEC